MTISGTIYVVDDDRGSRDSVCALARSMGVRATGFPSAEAFLADFDPTHYGCVVTDLRLQGMNGLELRRAIQARGWSLSMILISAYATVATAVEAMKGGMEFVLEKPYRDQELWQAIQSALRSEQAEREKTSRLHELNLTFDAVSADEEKVLTAVIAGAGNKQVASSLGIALRTVEDRRRRLIEKTGLGSIPKVIAAYTELQALNALQETPPN